jgi:acetyl-CoA carboxylase carboxyl transferase subunit beta
MSKWWTNLTRTPGFKKKAEPTVDARPEDPKIDDNDPRWIKCPITNDLICQPDDAPLWVTPAGFHIRIGPEERFRQLFDDGVHAPITLPGVPKDPLKFKDDRKYIDRLKAARAKVGQDDCMAAAYGRIGGAPAMMLVQNFEFMGGSLGMAAGEAFIAAAREAIARRAALICVAASGGARMQEGILSLMQMPRTVLAVQEVKRAGLPYIVILSDPTTGGVSASYAMLGDIHIVEPGALVGLTGPRVIEQTIRQKLPEGFQRAEFLHEKGMVDMVLDRRQMKPVLSSILQILMAGRLEEADADPAAAAAADATRAIAHAPVTALSRTPARRQAPARTQRLRAAE